MTRFLSRLDHLGQLKYLAWRTAGRRWPVDLALRSGLKFQLQPRKDGTYNNNDYGIAYEIFVHDYYNIPEIQDCDSVRTIVDLGGNVGFSTLYWLAKYKNATVEVFEPHPLHVNQINYNVKLNLWEGRTRLVPKAAGNASATLKLRDEGSSSALTSEEGAGFDVEVVDVFSILKGKRIDILKVDIEGAEYPILGDDRFRDVDVGVLIMEWHQVSADRNDHQWCVERLRDCGFEVVEIWSTASCGMVRAIRPPIAR